MTGRPSSFTQDEVKPKPGTDWEAYAAFMRGAALMPYGKVYTVQEAIDAGRKKDIDK